ncbi:hypothetical protein [Winogradskyella haliclonae]|uniref:Tetratricopeptide repeat protein n=1 Tax=Winogradskyella haliclonae TaxID=2048558 RepID=A0ABQ2BV61_9FLAO|nr:hypothetical protein [Winogradskyella haliclonae]GGI55944.1 hypothetical protein GCM10011444_02530 [Winogradskyella haliclonae]
MKKLILCICLLVTVFCNAQIDFVKHADLLMSARRAFEKNEPKRALDFYKEAFKINGVNTPAEYIKAATCAAQLRDEISCKKWIIEAIEKERISKKFLLSFSDNDLYRKCLNNILPNYDNHLANFYKAIDNPMVYFQIQELVDRDQVTRKLSDYHLGITDENKEVAMDSWLKARANNDTIAIKKLQDILFPKIDKELKAYNLKVMRYADSLNIVKLIDITKAHGWHNEAWVLLWHQRGSYGEKNWVWDFFKPYIDNEISKGKITPFFWVMFEDITSLYKTGKSIYGYHPGKVDPRTVNIKRQSIGLPELTQQEIKNRNTRKDNGSVF